MEIALQQEVDVRKVVAIAEAAGQTILNVYNQVSASLFHNR